jgi:hypothetical protein
MDRAPGTEPESVILWALRLFGLARPKQQPSPPSVRMISLYALSAALGLALVLTAHAVGFLLLGPCAGVALASWRHRRRASHSDSD